MLDSQRRSPGDTGYDPTTDPDSDQYGQGGNQDPTPPPNQNTLPTNGAAVASGTLGTKLPALQQLMAYLDGNPGQDPQAAIDRFKQDYPGEADLVPVYYPGTKTIGLANGTYLVAPHTGGNSADTWFTQPRGDESGNVGQFTGLQRPESVASPYNPATWGETYKVPSVTDLTNDPGYQADEASVQRGFERGAAAKGTILSGGFVGRTLPRAMNDFTSTDYKNLNDRNFANYQQRYNQFLDSNNLSLGARQLNENDYNADVTNNLNQYLTRYGAYQDLIKNNLSYANLGLNATTAGAPK